MPLRPALLCQNENCKPMFLPPAAEPAHPQQPAWPAGGGESARRSFLCPTCKEQRDYSLRDVQKVNQDPLEKPQNVVHISVRCREGVCDDQKVVEKHCRTKSLIETRTLLAFDVPKHRVREEALGIFAQFAHKTAKEIRCDNGHKLDGSYQPEVQDAAGYDEAWEYLHRSE